VSKPERTDEERHEFREDIVCRNQFASFLPGTTIEGRGTGMERLRGIDKVSPASGICKDVRYLIGLWGMRGAWCPLLTSLDIVRNGCIFLKSND
jgi:hypothetical protein